MELPLNTIIILVVMLVLLAILLILVSGSTGDLLDYGQDKIDVSGKTTDCQIVCFECCKGQTHQDCGPTGASNPEIMLCNCVDNKPYEFGC